MPVETLLLRTKTTRKSKMENLEFSDSKRIDAIEEDPKNMAQQIDPAVKENKKYLWCKGCDPSNCMGCATVPTNLACLLNHDEIFSR